MQYCEGCIQMSTDYLFEEPEQISDFLYQHSILHEKYQLPAAMAQDGHFVSCRGNIVCQYYMTYVK